MADISKINAVAIGSVAKLDAVLAANIAKVNGLVFSTGGAFLLDTYTGAAAAYSTRRLNSQYTGAAIRVREDSGDTETDIGFDASGNLLTADIATHCGSANGYVSKWYDQAASGGTGSGNDAAFSVSASQPSIYDGSAVPTANSIPALNFDAANGGASTSAFNLNDFGLYVVNQASTTPNSYQGTVALGGIANKQAVLNYRTSQQVYLGLNSGTNSTNTTYNLSSMYADNASSEVKGYFNNTEITSTTPSSESVSEVQVGHIRFISSTLFKGTMQELIAFGSSTKSDHNGIQGNVNAYFQIGNFGTPTSGLLSTYTGAAAAYSVRQLANTAALSMRVRRDNDDAEQDFGFDTNGDLDTAAIATFVGSGNNGYVSKWYDQSGNQNDAAQTTNGSQPQIYNGSAVITENGKPAVDFDGSNNHFDISWTQSASNYSLHAVTKNDSTASFLFDSNTGRLVFDGRGGSRGVYFDGSWKGTMHSGTAQQLQSIYAIAPSSGQSYVEGSQINTGLSYSQKAIGGATVLGGEKGGGAFLFNGTMQEWILYPSDQSSNRSGIETDINNYFSIY